MKNKKSKIQKADVIDKDTDRSWLYSEIVKDHFLNPRNVLTDEENYKFDAKGTSGNPLCGDVMTVWLKIDPHTKRGVAPSAQKNNSPRYGVGVDPKTQKIKECKWRTYGCASAIASTSMMSVLLTEKGGMPIEKALKLTPQEIVKRLAGLPPLKFHCSILGLDALKEAINDYFKKQKRHK